MTIESDVAHPDDTPVLSLTGERTAPGIWHENYWYRRHEAAYRAVPDWVGSPPTLVLDAGCGEGYAAQLLRSSWPASLILGVDYDAPAVTHAARTYGDERAAYLRGAVTALPLASAVFGAVLSLQVLEHIWTPADYVQELARVTANGGVIVLSTPNRLTFSPGLGRGRRPPSAYHCREYDADELRAELTRWLPGWAVTVHGVWPGTRLTAWQRVHGALPELQQATRPDEWSSDLGAVVRSVSRRDFEIGEPGDGCLDLVAVLERAGSPATPQSRSPKSSKEAEPCHSLGVQTRRPEPPPSR